jgi:hypothetical protein
MFVFDGHAHDWGWLEVKFGGVCTVSDPTYRLISR